MANAHKDGEPVNEVPPSTPHAESAYFDALTKDKKVRVENVPNKGKGMFLKEAVKADEIILTEKALVVSQDLADVVAGIPVCPQSLRTLELPEVTWQRVAGKAHGKTPRMPRLARYQERHHVKVVPCVKGCAELFASQEDKADADAAWHTVLCTGRMKKAQKDAYDEFIHGTWVQGGVDYSDTLHLALHAAATILTSRKKGKSVEEAYYPFDILAWAHWVPLASAWATRKSRATPRTLLAKLHASFSGVFTEEALADIGFTEDRLSRLVGCILLNSQERSPESEFSRYVQWLDNKGTKHELGEYDWRADEPTDLSNELYYSARAQGVYRVHSTTNHSCRPNCEVQYTTDSDQTIHMVALHDMAAGTEVHISYIDEVATRSLAYRQKYLLYNYRFHCACPRCNEEKEAGGSLVEDGDEEKGADEDAEEDEEVEEEESEEEDTEEADNVDEE